MKSELEKRIATELEGETAEAAYGRITIQRHALARTFTKQLNDAARIAWKITNTSSAHLQRYRVDVFSLEDGYSHSPRLTISAAKAYIAFLALENGNNEALRVWADDNNINISLWRTNIETQGYNGIRLWGAYKRGRIPHARYITGMERAHARHTNTNYDEIDKRGMTDYEVRELRRQASMV